ncbi:MAG: cell division protein ZapA [Pseudomonadota bacterium]|nr:cell division protein ZapA [Pseudomonadota bacterium]
MALVEISINGRDYQIVCEDGKEEHLSELGLQIDERVKDLVAAIGQVGESRLLAMASLVLADELQAALRDKGEVKSTTNAEPTAECIEEKLVSVIDAAVERIETVSRQLL